MQKPELLGLGRRQLALIKLMNENQHFKAMKLIDDQPGEPNIYELKDIHGECEKEINKEVFETLVKRHILVEYFSDTPSINIHRTYYKLHKSLLLKN